jgi:hypothetical protein
MKSIILSFVFVLLLLNLSIFHNFQIVNAQNTSTTPSLKTVIDNINKSLAKLTEGNTSGLLQNTMTSINETAFQLANESKGIVNENSLNTAEIIAKKLGIGIADVLGNISGEIKQGIESR